MAVLRPSEIPRLSRAGQLELSARRILDGLYSGAHRSPHFGPASEFADHRAYVLGDDLRSIDWRAYARSDQLLVRRYREERGLPLVLALDTSASMAYGTPAKSDWAQLAAAMLGMLACDGGDQVQLYALGTLGERLGGAGGGMALCAALSDLPWAGAAGGAELLAALGGMLQQRSLIILLGDLYGDPQLLARQVGALDARGHEVAALQILDRSEVSLPAEWGSVELSDAEGILQPLGCDAVEAKTGYDAAMRSHRSACSRALAGVRADCVFATTDQNQLAVLGPWLHARRQR